MNAPRISLSVSLPLLAATLLACSSAPQTESLGAREDLGHEASAVIKGKNSDSTQNQVVLLVYYDPSAGIVAACSGSLLAPNLVLTARHCVADTDESAACDVMGNPLASGVVRGNHKPETLYVFTGLNRPDFNSSTLKPDAQGAKILDDGGKNLCNHDIAMVVLKDPIPNAQIAQIRLDSPVVKTDILTAVGWGVTDKAPEPQIRQQRTGIAVDLIGPDDTGQQSVPPNEFQVGESICSGDSGGPAIAASGAMVGVVSRGGNGTMPDQNNPSSSCVGPNAQNLYTKVAPFKDFIMSGYALVGADPWVEGGPDPRLAKTGVACTAGTDCRSALCLIDPSQAGALTCAQDCSTDACPDGQTCKVEGSAQVCRVPVATPTNNGTVTTKTGCSMAAGSSGSSPSAPLGFVLAALGLVALRRRR